MILRVESKGISATRGRRSASAVGVEAGLAGQGHQGPLGGVAHEGAVVVDHGVVAEQAGPDGLGGGVVELRG